MIKKINYFAQAFFIYLFFITGRILGIKISRKIFSFLFSFIGPFFKSKKTIDKNFYIFDKKISLVDKNKIIHNMWKNYGMTFIEYIFLNFFRKTNTNIEIIGENNLKTPIDKSV